MVSQCFTQTSGAMLPRETVTASSRISLRKASEDSVNNGIIEYHREL